MIVFFWIGLLLLGGWLSWSLYSLQNPQRCQYAVTSSSYSRCFEPLLPIHERVDFELYVGAGVRPPSKPIWSDLNVSLLMTIETSIKVDIPPEVRAGNASMKFWFSINKARSSSGEISVGEQQAFAPNRVLSGGSLTVMQVPARKKKRKLLEDTSGTKREDAQAISESERPHWKFSVYPLTIRIVHFDGIVLATNILRALGVRLHARRLRREQNMLQSVYEPFVFLDETSLLQGHQAEVSPDTSRPAATLRLKYAPMSLLLLSFKLVVTDVIKMIKLVLGDVEVEEFKYWLSDDRIFRYLLTQLISLFHVVLEYLAFRGDWHFFVGRKSFAGLSISSLGFGVLRSLIIFLYLLDSGTSTIILFSIGKDIIWSAWKLFKVLRSRQIAQESASHGTKLVERAASTAEIEARVMQAGCSVKALTEDELHRFTTWCDHRATIHMGLCVYPMVVGMAVYSMQYHTYASWWSWLISSLADSVYLFGFVSMCPQLYVNYKLQSVAHMPLGALGYKVFNTFIDDIFAFLVKMPLKHRIMTLRDDVIFLGFLYQWWAYKADRSRPNEFGFKYEGADHGEGESVKEGESDTDENMDNKEVASNRVQFITPCQ